MSDNRNIYPIHICLQCITIQHVQAACLLCTPKDDTLVYKIQNDYY